LDPKSYTQTHWHQMDGLGQLDPIRKETSRDGGGGFKWKYP